MRADRRLLPAGARVLCAVSGGADSVCLLHLLLAERDLTVLCAHYNHGLRGAEAERDEEFVRALCARWDVPFFAGRGNVAAFARQNRLSLEMAARTLRYAFLEEAAGKSGADLIATAHTATDNAETVLLHLARGSGARGLGGIAPRRGRIVRPLLGVTRAEVEEYLAARSLPHVEDSTNVLDDAARNRVRHYALPALRSVNGALEQSIGRAARLLRADEDYLEESAAALWPRVWDGEALSVSALTALPEALAFRLLRRFAGEGAALTHLEALWALCHSSDPSGETALPAGVLAQRSYDRLALCESGGAAALPERIITPGETLLLPEAGLLLRAEHLPPEREVQKSFNTFSFSCANICGKLSVASRREGDKLAFCHREGTHTLKKLMLDAKIPRRQRALIPVIRDEEGVLAVYGFGQARRAAAQPGEEALGITINKIVRESYHEG